MSRQPQRGYILVTMLLLIASLTVISSYLFLTNAIYEPFGQLVVEREQARHFALSGLQLAIGTVAQPKTQSKEKKDEKPEAQESVVAQMDQQFLQTLLLSQGWQTYPFTHEKEGIDGVVRFCISCEEGKININQLYDFKKKQFVLSGQPADAKKMIGSLFEKVETMMQSPGLFGALEQFLKKRETPLNDVTELLLAKEFAAFRNNIWYQPEQNSAENSNKKLYLTDLFTVYPSTSMLNPWLLSVSLQRLLQMQELGTVDAQKKKELVQKTVKQFKKTVDWKGSFDQILAPLYGKELRSLPKDIESIFAKEFEPRYFGVRSHGTFKQATVQLYAIVERVKRTDTQKALYDVKIRKMYWL